MNTAHEDEQLIDTNEIVETNETIEENETHVGINEIKFDNTQLKHLVNEISNLSLNEMKEVFKILDKNEIKYTENSNGIYFVLSHVSNNVLNNIKKFLLFCQTNKETLDSIDHAQLNEKQNIDKTIKVSVINNNPANIDNKYITKITHQNELDKYGLNLDENESVKTDEDIDIALNKTKMKYTGIKSKIIKTTGKSNKSVTGGKSSKSSVSLPSD